MAGAWQGGYRALLGVIAILALTAIGVSGWQLQQAHSGLEITRTSVGQTPVSLYRPRQAEQAPVVVIAHGFAGSRQLMQPFALTLARNGYLVATLDFPGHGKHPQPMPGELTDREGRLTQLLGTLRKVVDYAQNLPQAAEQLVLLGHSMGGDTVIQYARRYSETTAVIAVSPYIPKDFLAETVPNLLLVYGGWEPASLSSQGRRIVASVADEPPRQGKTYGEFAKGNARQYQIATGVEHIGVLYSQQSLQAALDWSNTACGHSNGGYIDQRGPWIGLLILGVILLAWPLTKLLPRVTAVPAGADLPWRQFWWLALAPALVTPLILQFLPSDFLPLLLADYLALHFGLYGLVTLLGLAWAVGWQGLREALTAAPGRFVLAAGAALGYAIIAIGWPTEMFVASFWLTPERVPLLLPVLVGTLLYFLGDEWLTRGAQAPPGAYLLTKLAFLGSLVFAIGLNLTELFFLVIILPAILSFFIIYGLFSQWLYARTNHPYVAVVANAVMFAWAITVTFPLVGG